MSSWQDHLLAWDQQAFLDANIWLHEISGATLGTLVVVSRALALSVGTRNQR